MRLPLPVLSLSFALLFAPAHADTVELGITPDTISITSFLNEKGKAISQTEFETAAAAGKVWSKRTVMDKDGKPKSIQFALTRPDADGKLSSSPFKSFAHLESGDSFPDFELKTAGGKRYSHRDLRGKISLVNFSFAGCGPCIQEVPSLNKIAAAHPDVQFLSITFDDADTSSGFITRTGFRWPQLVSAKAVMDKIDVRSFPSFALVGADGKVIAADFAGMDPHDPDAMDKWLGKHLPSKS